jgi:hypothetical protein
MKDWNIEDLDEITLDVFLTATKIAEETGLFFNNSDLFQINNLGKIELILFNLFYAWKYIQDNDLVTMTPDNAKIYITTGSMCVKAYNKNIDIGEFMLLYKDRFVNHNKEFKTLIDSRNNETPYFPQYFFKQILKDSASSNILNNYNLHMILANYYIDLINHLKIQLDYSFN